MIVSALSEIVVFRSRIDGLLMFLAVVLLKELLDLAALRCGTFSSAESSAGKS